MIIILIAIYIFPVTGARTPACNTTCGTTHYDFPFGFSPGCPINLTCKSNGTVSIDEFQVQSIGRDAFHVSIPAKCNRSIETVRHLFGRNFAPTSRNGILLQNCHSQITGCKIPTTDVQTNFGLLNCSSNKSPSNVSCYSELDPRNQFIDYGNLTRAGCGSLFSAISTEFMGSSPAVSLGVQLIQMGWWVEGSCQCSENAVCSAVAPTPAGSPGFRCQCLDGFLGDGFRAGLGCWKASSKCNPAKYMSGSCGGSAQVGVLIGGIVAGACFMISLGLIFCFIRKRSVTKTRNIATRRLSEATGITIPIYPYKVIEKATDNFCEKRLLGTGAFGTVYSGKLDSSEWVAIKRIKQRGTDSVDQVANEIRLISSVNHPNLVRLLGCSIDHGEQILVYEYMPNGTLAQHLHREKSSTGLTWPVRLTIAAETAQAISYLHFMNPPIYHRDIKSSNILLDYNFKSKVADFGLSRLGIVESSHISTAPQGTPGYLDPQYHQNFQLSDKSDVYSFGVVLVEMITGLRAVDFSRPHNDVNLASLAVDRIGKGCLDQIIDPTIELLDGGWTMLSVQKVAEIAFRCLASHQDMRPAMIEVATELEQVRVGRWQSPEESMIITMSSKATSFSSCSTVSHQSEVPLKKKDEFETDFSPVSVQDPWVSARSSPSSSCLLTNVS